MFKTQNIDDTNLTCVSDQVKKLKKERFKTSWEDLETLESKILYLENLLAQGVYYEPKF